MEEVINGILIREVETKNIMTKSSLPVGGYSVNPYVGCTHACKYCYVDLTSALLTTLGHIKDYRCIMDYGPRALEIEPGILTAYYWIIIAADETGNSMAREKFLQKAAEDLIDEENEKLMKLLALRNHIS